MQNTKTWNISLFKNPDLTSSGGICQAEKHVPINDKNGIKIIEKDGKKIFVDKNGKPFSVYDTFNNESWLQYCEDDFYGLMNINGEILIEGCNFMTSSVMRFEGYLFS